jgi:hypothetical protein
MYDEGLVPDYDSGDFHDPGIDPQLAEPGDELVHGADESPLWQPQEVDGLCAPTSAAMVISEFEGGVVGKDDVAEVAAEHGLITQGPGGWNGMTADETAQLLGLYGIPCHVAHGSLETLSGHLDDNHGVILAVDSGEIWGLEPSGERGAEPDHALLVTAIDELHGTATLNDPGDPGGAGREVGLAVLQDAWADSGNLMVVTDAVPGEAPHEDGGGTSAWVILPVALLAGGAAAAWVSDRRRRRLDGEDEQHANRVGPAGPSRLAFGDDELD